MQIDLLTFLSGMTSSLYFIAALLFLRFYRKTRDRLFLCFAASFAILGCERILFVLLNVPDEADTVLYAIRLISFGLIIFAIIDKNLARKSPLPDSASNLSANRRQSSQ